MYDTYTAGKNGREGVSMRMRVRGFSSFVAALGVLATAYAANATPLPPGATVVPGIALVNGSVEADTGLVAFSLGPISGTVREWVISGNTFNPLGGLSFVYQFSVTSGDVARLTGFAYDAFAVDVEQNLGGLGQVGVIGTRLALTADRTGSGNTVGFNFNPEVTPGALSTSGLLIVNTNANFFTAALISVIDGATATVGGFAPTVPEPASILLLGVGLVGVGVLQRKRSRRS